MGWDPASLSYKPARVRENAMFEKNHIDPSIFNIGQYKEETSESSDSSDRFDSTFGLWPSGGKCSVRAEHLPRSLVHQIGVFVAHEMWLYKLAVRLDLNSREFHGDSFAKGLERLQTANQQLSSCISAI
jgi:hypothetical protein